MDIIEIQGAASLDDLEIASPDISDVYWSPEQGEVLRVIYVGVEDREVPDYNDRTQVNTLRCAVMLRQELDGNFSTIINGSKRLVATLAENNIEGGTPLQIKYLGRQQNRTNSNSSDRWQVLKLRAKKGSA